MRVCTWLVALVGLLVVVMGVISCRPSRPSVIRVPIASWPGYEPSSLVQEWGLAEVLGLRRHVNQHSSLKDQGRNRVVDLEGQPPEGWQVRIA